MDELTLLRAMNGIHEEDVVMAGKLYFNENTVRKTSKRIFTLALAAALLLALGAAAYAVWSVHISRQQDLRTDLKIEENNASSYMEYDVTQQEKAGSAASLILLSAVNDGTEQRIYVDVSPVEKENIARFPADVRFAWSLAGTEIGGFAGPQLPVSLSLSGDEAIRNAVLDYAYDEETQTLTLQCYADVKFIEKAMADLGTDSVPLQVHMIVGENDSHTFGPVPFKLTDEQTRSFDFGPAQYHDKELDKTIEIVGLELTPFSAVWKVRYEDAASFHTPGADQAAYRPWSILEDRVCIDAKLIFSDGSAFSTGGALTCPFENGVVNLHCGWGSAINIDDVQRIVLGDLVLWELKAADEEMPRQAQDQQQ